MQTYTIALFAFISTLLSNITKALSLYYNFVAKHMQMAPKLSDINHYYPINNTRVLFNNNITKIAI